MQGPVDRDQCHGAGEYGSCSGDKRFTTMTTVLALATRITMMTTVLARALAARITTMTTS